MLSLLLNTRAGFIVGLKLGGLCNKWNIVYVRVPYKGYSRLHNYIHEHKQDVEVKQRHLVVYKLRYASMRV